MSGTNGDTKAGMQALGAPAGMSPDEVENVIDRVMARRSRASSTDNGKTPQWFNRLQQWALGIIMVGWIGWVTTECLLSYQFRSAGDRYTAQDAAAALSDLKAELPDIIRVTISEPIKKTKQNAADIRQLQQTFIRIETKLDMAIKKN